MKSIVKKLSFLLILSGVLGTEVCASAAPVLVPAESCKDVYAELCRFVEGKTACYEIDSSVRHYPGAPLAYKKSEKPRFVDDQKKCIKEVLAELSHKTFGHEHLVSINAKIGDFLSLGRVQGLFGYYLPDGDRERVEYEKRFMENLSVQCSSLSEADKGSLGAFDFTAIEASVRECWEGSIYSGFLSIGRAVLTQQNKDLKRAYFDLAFAETRALKKDDNLFRGYRAILQKYQREQNYASSLGRVTAEYEHKAAQHGVKAVYSAGMKDVITQTQAAHGGIPLDEPTLKAALESYTKKLMRDELLKRAEAKPHSYARNTREEVFAHYFGQVQKCLERVEEKKKNLNLLPLGSRPDGADVTLSNYDYVRKLCDDFLAEFIDAAYKGSDYSRLECLGDAFETKTSKNYIEPLLSKIYQVISAFETKILEMPRGGALLTRMYKFENDGEAGFSEREKAQFVAYRAQIEKELRDKKEFEKAQREFDTLLYRREAKQNEEDEKRRTAEYKRLEEIYRREAAQAQEVADRKIQAQRAEVAAKEEAERKAVEAEIVRKAAEVAAAVKLAQEEAARREKCKKIAQEAAEKAKQQVPEVQEKADTETHQAQTEKVGEEQGPVIHQATNSSILSGADSGKQKYIFPATIAVAVTLLGINVATEYRAWNNGVQRGETTLTFLQYLKHRFPQMKVSLHEKRNLLKWAALGVGIGGGIAYCAQKA